MTVFEGLVISHLLGDWLLQTEWQAQNKRTNVLALLTHIIIYHAVILAVLLLAFRLPLIPTLATVVVLGVLHAVLDRQAAVLWIMKTMRLVVTREPERWLFVAIDQSLHIVALGIAALYLAGVNCG